MENKKVSKEDISKFKNKIIELSDEELDKIAGGIEISTFIDGESKDLWCEAGCYPKLNGCYCDDEW